MEEKEKEERLQLIKGKRDERPFAISKNEIGHNKLKGFTLRKSSSRISFCFEGRVALFPPNKKSF